MTIIHARFTSVLGALLISRRNVKSALGGLYESKTVAVAVAKTVAVAEAVAKKELN